MAHRVQPQTTRGHGGYDYGSQPISFDGEGARRVRTGGFGPDATQIQSQGQSSFRRMYDQIRKADEREQEGEDKPKVMESNPVDEFMSNLYRIGENISQPGAVRDLQESDDPIEHFAGFAIGLPLGTIGAIPQGVAQGYEAFSGRGVIDEDREEGTVRSLDSNQRAASAVNAGINLVGTAFGGSGSMLKGGYRAARTGLAKLGGGGAERGAGEGGGGFFPRRYRRVKPLPSQSTVRVAPSAKSPRMMALATAVSTRLWMNRLMGRAP